MLRLMNNVETKTMTHYSYRYVEVYVEIIIFCWFLSKSIGLISTHFCITCDDIFDFGDQWISHVSWFSVQFLGDACRYVEEPHYGQFWVRVCWCSHYRLHWFHVRHGNYKVTDYLALVIFITVAWNTTVSLCRNAAENSEVWMYGFTAFLLHSYKLCGADSTKIKQLGK